MKANRQQTERRDRNTSRVSVLALVAVLLAAAAWPAGAATTRQWAAGNGTWDDTTAANWNPSGVPVNGDTANLTSNTAANISIGYTATGLTGSGLAATTIGNAAGGITTLNLDGTDLLPTATFTLNGGGAINQTGGTLTNATSATISGGAYTMSGGTWFMGGVSKLNGGTFTQTDGTVATASHLILNSGTWTISGGTNKTVNDVYVALETAGTATLNVSGGTINDGRIFQVGGGPANSTGVVNQTAGTVNVTSYLRLSANGTYNLYGGTLNSGYIIGMAAGSVFNQTGGVHNALSSFSDIGSGATYNLSGGVYLGPGVTVEAGGTLNQTGGTITNQQNMTVNGTYTIKGGTAQTGSTLGGARKFLNNVTGTVQGYGTISSRGGGGDTTYSHLLNDGRIIANGYGVPHTLDLSGYGLASNSVDNTSNKGWFAVNQGKLVLPTLTLSAQSAVNWGETLGASSIDLVNSARFTFSGNVSGSLTGALLAVDRADANGPAPVPYGFISVHNFDSSGFAIPGGTFSLAIRYDDSFGHEDTLKMFQYVGSTWTPVSFTVDTNNRWITATGLTSFGEFGIAIIPEPSLVFLLACGGVVFWRVGRRRH